MGELANLSLEDEDFVIEGPEAHFDNSIKNPLTQKDYMDCVNVIDTWKGVNERGFITRNDVTRLHDLREGFPHLDRFFKRNPLNSFATEPSVDGFAESNENFVLTIGKAIINALKAAIQWIIEKAQALWKWFNSATQQSSKIESLRGNVLALQDYLRDVVPALKSGSSSVKFDAAFKRAVDTQRNNTNREWNALAEDILRSGGKYTGYVESFCIVLKANVPEFIQGTAKFLELLRAAETEQDVQAAVDFNTLDRGGATGLNSIVALAVEFGYNSNARRDKGVGDWQAKCQIILGKFRSLANDRKVQMVEGTFFERVTTFSIDEWSGKMKDAEDYLGKSIPDAIKELRAFNATSLKPGLEQAYRDHLATYLPALVSILQGFSHIQETVGLIAKTRDKSVHVLSKSALEMVKTADAFVRDNFDSLTLSQQVIRKRHKQVIVDTFG